MQQEIDIETDLNKIFCNLSARDSRCGGTICSLTDLLIPSKIEARVVRFYVKPGQR